MDHLAEILVMLFAALLAAKVGDEIFKRLGLPSVIGEILAGVLVGPAVLWAAMGMLMLLFRTLLWFRYRTPPLAGMADAPAMTVIIPAYNEGAMVARTIESVARARYPLGRLEIFVVDDGSSDDTWVHILRGAAEFPALVTPLRFDRNRGKRAAPLMGKLILKLRLVPDQILSSTAVRARTTAAIVAENCGFKGAIELHKELYAADAESIVHVVSEVYHDDSRLLVVGHNPGMEQLLFALTRADEHLPTAGLAHIELPLNTWRGLSASSRGTLIHLCRPKEMR